MKINKLIDHTLLKQDATEAQIDQLCQEAIEYDFKSVCVNPHYVKRAHENLMDSDVLVCSVIGFPLGMNTSESKVFETQQAIEEGAKEIDMVINVGALKDGNDTYILNEISQIKRACGKNKLKVIIEACLLSDEEKVRACKLAVEAGADFVKTSTGFSLHGATIEDVKLMKDTVQDKAEVKAAGGVRNIDDLKNMVKVGATRIGTSGGVALMEDAENQENY
ncbi:MAG TPA: deoxyribose-phosphate aldolase [Erysipelothrix sp.]|nr:deoxyribose-phosphate aldolase [Erysipelothrix sp.]